MKYLISQEKVLFQFQIVYTKRLTDLSQPCVALGLHKVLPKAAFLSRWDQSLRRDQKS